MARLMFVSTAAPSVREGSGTFVGITVLRRAVEALGHSVELVSPEIAIPPSWPRRLAFNLGLSLVPRKRLPDAVIGFDLDGVFLRAPRDVSIASIKGVAADEARFERGNARILLELDALLERIHVRRAGRVVVSSEYSRAEIVRRYGVPPERIAVVPEPIELERWQEALRSAEPLKRSIPTILCVAHLYPRKDVATLLRAMAALHGEAVLRVIGVGPELQRLKRLSRRLSLGSRVEFLGHLAFDRLASEYRSADLFCLPSRQEGFGIVFLEAMAAGLPVVAARAAAVPEVVPDGECGVLVPPGDPDALAGALDGLLADSRARERLADQARRHVERYDAPRVAREFLEAIGFAQRRANERPNGVTGKEGGPSPRRTFRLPSPCRRPRRTHRGDSGPRDG